MIKAITPLEARKSKVISEFVLSAINDVLTQKIGNRKFVILHKQNLLKNYLAINVKISIKIWKTMCLSN